MFRRFGVSVGILVFLLSAGTIGYMVLEGWTVIDALYMTVITFTTVGYQEVQPLSTAGRIFNIFLIVGGVGAMLYFLTALMSHIVEEEVFHAFVRRRRMRSTLASMRRHYILCGFGRVGREVGRAFAAEGVEFIVIDANDNCIVEAQELGYAYIQGNATEDDILREAGIEHAEGLVAVTGNDSDNVYITLSARGLNETLQVVARTSDIANAEKLKRAGADKVISPLEIGGRRIAMSAVRPLPSISWTPCWKAPTMSASNSPRFRLPAALRYPVQPSPLLSATPMWRRSDCGAPMARWLPRRKGTRCCNPAIACSSSA